ncbi:MAG TPA: bifunctional diaminohydroxyphosphoribosylaminopyrimidine deaminase/5-amino-6-(5-phosphoribosylamino)uracil reductase RibD [Coriobacteriia bacterium]
MARLFGDAQLPASDPWLRRAMELAERGRGTTSPNPVVGCVLVREGAVVGEGFHERAGGPHAEIVALEAAGDAAQGATAYVTLEPCNHHGRTAPCADALVRAGVSRVVMGMRDPNPGVAGGGAATLRAAGVEVEFAADASPFEEQLLEWTTFVLTGRPFVRVKVAVTLDGHPGLAEGVRSQLTGQGAAEVTMRLRRAADAVLVGAGTVTVDDPSLTARDPEGRPDARQPLRVVLARTTTPPATARLFGDGRGPAAVLQPEETDADPAIVATGARVIGYPVAEGLAAAFAALGREGVASVLVEAGPRLLTALLDDDLVDELVLIHAGGMAGAGAPPLYVGESQQDPSTLARGMRAIEAGVAGGDAVTVWRRSGADDED